MGPESPCTPRSRGMGSCCRGRWGPFPGALPVARHETPRGPWMVTRGGKGRVAVTIVALGIAFFL